MRPILILSVAGVLALGATGASAQLLGGNVGGGLTGHAGGAAIGGGTLADVATRPAGVDANVRGGAFLSQPQGAVNAAARAGVGARTDVSVPARASAQAGANGGYYAPPQYQQGSYVWDGRAWVWVPQGQRYQGQYYQGQYYQGQAYSGANASVGVAVPDVNARAGVRAGGRIR